MRLSSCLVGVLVFGMASCQKASSGPEEVSWDRVAETWSGAAEISRYELKQERYGEIRKGEAVLIFVREPFLKDRQVKDESGRGEFQVLKLNSTRSFLTGVYPYSTMVSVFQPLEEGAVGEALKVTTSVQEWCGHVFMQTSRKNGKITTEVKSYFEQDEGDTFEEKASVFLEDEVWTAIRLQPQSLPVGKVQMVPSGLSSRFSHRDPVAQTATARWLEGSDKDTVIYEITYLESGRVVAIEIQKTLPYAIEGWRESRGEVLLSSGQLKDRVVNVDYWNYNGSSKGRKLRSKLGF